MSLTSGNAEMQENSDSDDENDDDIPLANLFNIRNRLDQIGFTMDDLVNVDSEVVSIFFLFMVILFVKLTKGIGHKFYQLMESSPINIINSHSIIIILSMHIIHIEIYCK